MTEELTALEEHALIAAYDNGGKLFDCAEARQLSYKGLVIFECVKGFDAVVLLQTGGNLLAMELKKNILLRKALGTLRLYADPTNASACIKAITSAVGALDGEKPTTRPSDNVRELMAANGCAFLTACEEPTTFWALRGILHELDKMAGADPE